MFNFNEPTVSFITGMTIGIKKAISSEWQYGELSLFGNGFVIR